MKKSLICLLLVSLLAACASQQPPVAIIDYEPQAVIKTSETGDAPPTAPAHPHVGALDPVDEPNSILAKRSVYYPFDVYTVQDNGKPVVQAHAQYLNEQANRKVRLEGNCDERGSNEYNLALGQRRADGVQKMLQLGGVKDRQIDAVSYGEEKPTATGHDEASWGQNRRTDLNYR